MQNRSISSEICLENNHEIGKFFREFVPKNPTKFDFFFRNLSEALVKVLSTMLEKKEFIHIYADIIVQSPVFLNTFWGDLENKNSNEICQTKGVNENPLISTSAHVQYYLNTTHKSVDNVRSMYIYM